MVYNSQYTSSDMQPILVDVLGEFGIQIVAFMGLILAIVVVGFLISRFKRR
jgi:hypothetical protein